MRRVLITLLIITGFALAAAPAVAQEGSEGSTPSPTESTEPPEESPSPPADTTAPETPGPEETTSSDPSQGSDSSTRSDSNPGSGSNPGTGQTPGTGETPGTVQPLSTEQTAAIDQAVEAGLAALESLRVVIAAFEPVSICHFPPGEPNNPQFITIGQPAVLAAHLKNHDGDFVASEESDCGGDPQEPGEEDPKITICHFPPGNPENVQFISISINALDMHLEQHGDFIADSESDCFDEGDDDDDGDDEDGDEDEDGAEDEDGDDDKAAALPDTGGPSQWNLVLGVILTVLGMAVLVNRESMLRTGLFGPVPAVGPTMPWSSTVDRAADLPLNVVKQESHRAGWTVFGLLMLAAAFLGRRSSK